MTVTIKDRQVRKYLNTVTDRFGNIDKKSRQYVGILSAIVLRDVIDHFEEEKDPKRRWQDWSKNYRKRMVKIGKGGNMILQDTGRLKGGWQPTNYRTSRDGILWFNPVHYANTHDQGDRNRNIPRREFSWISDTAVRQMETQTIKYLGLL